ncbi:fimbrial biogenesis chaperone [Solimonas variicoloris]|uniref:fimbrial biogenesis chaperone n=1 Tax=Solimonas variicoloris TaxID=254408 RepID=UPI00037A1F60|nr:fimbria/pilus periplasmic chaperone [Solimonas variicoloris]
MRLALLRRFGVIAALLIAAPLRAAPGGIAVSPLRLDMAAARPTAALTAANSDAAAHRFQIELLRWTQPGGRDHYEATDALIANPPLFELAPGAQQVVRVGLLDVPAGSDEQAFRLYLTEIPRASEPPASQLNFMLRLGVPLFVAPQGAVRRSWRWSARLDGQTYVLRADNDGNVHQRRAGLRLFDADRQIEIGHDAGFRDVLPGAYSEWRFAAAPPLARRLRISATTDAGADDSTIPLATP